MTQGAAQAATAAFVLSGNATVGWLIAVQGLYGVGNGFVVPAEVGLVPQTVSAERLQQANALQGLSRQIVFAVGPDAVVNALCLGLMLLIRSVWAIRPREDATTMAAA